MRYRKPFTVFPKKTKIKKVIFYYRVFDEFGKLIVQKSTGQTTRTAAEAFCFKLLKENLLIPVISKDILFKEFAANWWIYDKCDYIKSRLVRDFTFSRMHANIKRMILKKHILPVFGNYKLSVITEKMIETWLFKLKNQGLENSTVNNCLGTFKIMLNEAHRQKLVTENPIKSIRPLKKNSKVKGILTEQEVKLIFNPVEMNNNWINQDYYTLNLLAACTGMRLGEIQALRFENVFPDYIFVCHSYERKFGLKGTKTNKNREIPINPILHTLLATQINKNPKGYLFPANKGETPYYCRCITDAFYKALDRIGIKESDRKERNLTFHSHRHFFNSFVRGKMDDYKLRMLTGHTTQAMTDLYSHVSKD